jgi:hypothetical protein
MHQINANCCAATGATDILGAVLQNSMLYESAVEPVELIFDNARSSPGENDDIISGQAPGSVTNWAGSVIGELPPRSKAS